MKPTSDERSEVAEKLREPFDVLPQGRYYHAHYTLFGMGLYASSEGALRLGVRRLADLIEPEERTCHIVMISTGVWECDECFGGIDWDSYDEDDPPNCNFCPNCGAKVIDGGAL